VKKVKRVMAALLVCMVLITSIVQHTQVDVYAVAGIDDVVAAGFMTLVGVALALNGYNTGPMESLHDFVSDKIDFIVDMKNYLSWRLNQNYENNRPVIEEVETYLQNRTEGYRQSFKKAWSWAFGLSGMSEKTEIDIKSLIDVCSNIKDSSVKISNNVISVVWNLLKETGIQQIDKSESFGNLPASTFLPYETFADFWGQCGSSMKFDQFATKFTDDTFYLGAYDSSRDWFFVIPLDQSLAYVFGHGESGYRLVSYELDTFSVLSENYNSGILSEDDLISSGNRYLNGFKYWRKGVTSYNSIYSSNGSSIMQYQDAKRIQAYVSGGSSVSADFDKCFIVCPKNYSDVKTINFFSVDDNGKLVCNTASKYADITSLGASASALAGIKLGTDDELELDTLLLQQILSRLNSDSSISSDDIADMVASKNQALLDSITSVSSSTVGIKDEVAKGNGFLASIDATASQIKDIVTDIPGSIVDALSLAIAVVGGDIVGVATGIFDVVTDVAQTTADLFDIIYRAVVAALKACFVLPDEFFEEWRDIFIGMLQNKLSLEGYLNFISDIRDITASKLEDFKVTLFGTECTVLTFSWYYKNIGTINDLIRGFTYIVLVFFNINQAYKMLRGTSLMKIEFHQEGG